MHRSEEHPTVFSQLFQVEKKSDAASFDKIMRLGVSCVWKGVPIESDPTMSSLKISLCKGITYFVELYILYIFTWQPT